MHVHIAEPINSFHEKVLIWQSGGQLAALDLGGRETRNISVLRLVAAAGSRSQLPDFAPLLVHTGDRPINEGTTSWRCLSFASADGYRDRAVPDFLFDGWPQVGLDDYEQVRLEAAAAGAQAPMMSRLGWIGNCEVSERRCDLIEIAHQHPELIEAEHVSWLPGDGERPMKTAAGNYLTLAEQTRRWAFLLDIEGYGWSARLKLLLHSGRPVFVQERPWQEWYWQQLEPMRHYIPVKRDLSDLIERVRWALANREQAQAIGAAGRALAERILTREAALATWAQTLKAMAAAPSLPYAPASWRAVLDPALIRLGAPIAPDAPGAVDGDDLSGESVAA